MSEEHDASDEQELDLEALIGGMEEARAHHYVFAHLTLPQIILRLDARKVDLRPMAEDPELFDKLFAGLWARVGADVAAKGEGQRLPETGLAASYHESGKHSALVLTLPEATRVTEAIAIAIVRVPTKRLWLFESAELRYLTLELGVNFGEGEPASARTVLCEWTRDGAHHNMGDGPSLAEFGAAALARCGAQR